MNGEGCHLSVSRRYSAADNAFLDVCLRECQQHILEVCVKVDDDVRGRLDDLSLGSRLIVAHLFCLGDDVLHSVDRYRVGVPCVTCHGEVAEFRV